MVLLLLRDVADPYRRAQRAREIVEAERSLEQRYRSALGVIARNDLPAGIELGKQRRRLGWFERRNAAATGNARFLR